MSDTQRLPALRCPNERAPAAWAVATVAPVRTLGRVLMPHRPVSAPRAPSSFFSSSPDHTRLETAPPAACGVTFVAAAASGSITMADSVAAPLPPPTRLSAVLQAKLQRAIWLDQLTTITTAESHARAATRCSEAETRDEIWWWHQNACASLCGAARIAVSQRATDQAWILAEQSAAPVYDPILINFQESVDRAVLEGTEQDSFEMLCAAFHAEELQMMAAWRTQEQCDAVELQRTAVMVREAEHKIAVRSFRPAFAYTPSMDDFFPIVKAPSTLPPLRRSTLTAPPSEAPCEARIREMYDRRALHYEEEKDRLFLEWCFHTQRMYEEETRLFHRTFALWKHYTRSPACMRALLVLQRWWRMLRAAPWSHHRRGTLRHAVLKLPSHCSTEKCKRSLRRLQDGPVLADARGLSNQRDIAKAMQALVRAATQPLRRAILLDEYTNTLARSARALLASRPPPDLQAVARIGVFPLLLCRVSRRRASSDNWRCTRWMEGSGHHRWAAEAMGCTEGGDGVSVRLYDDASPHDTFATHRPPLCGFPVVMMPSSSKLILIAAEVKERGRIMKQEICERSFLRMTSAASLARRSATAESGEAKHIPFNREQDTTNVCASQPLVALSPASSVVAHSITLPKESQAPSSPPKILASYADVLHHKQLAHDKLASAQALSAVLVQSQNYTAAGLQPTLTTVSDDAVVCFRNAFDGIAVAVYQDEYTSVRQRYVQQNAKLLSLMRQSFEQGLRERALIIAEEARERWTLDCDRATAQHIRRFELERKELKERAALQEECYRAATTLEDKVHASLELDIWLQHSRALGCARNSIVAARPSQKTQFPMPSLSPVERLCSREAVCRARIESERLAALAAAYLQNSLFLHETMYAVWHRECRAVSDAVDETHAHHPPLARWCLISAEESDKRRLIWREACLGASSLERLLVDVHTSYGTRTLWPDFLFGHLKLVSEATYMDAQLRELLLMRVANIESKVEELITMETKARSRVEYAEGITRDLRFHLHRLVIE